MGTSVLKSAVITNLDAVPPVPNTTGKGAAGALRVVNGYITTVAADDTSSTYRLVRLPSAAVVKHIIFEAAAMAGSSAVHVGLFYSDATNDGTQPALQGTVIDADFFGQSISVVNAVVPTDIVGEGGFYTLNERNLPLWQAAGLTADPGGFFDVVVSVSATINTGALLGVEAQYVD